MKIKSILTGTALSVGTGGLIAKGAAVLLHITFPAAATLGLIVAGACELNNLAGLIAGENDAKEEFKETEDSRNEKLIELIRHDKVNVRSEIENEEQEKKSVIEELQRQNNTLNMKVDSGFKAHNTRIMGAI